MAQKDLSLYDPYPGMDPGFEQFCTMDDREFIHFVQQIREQAAPSAGK